MCPFLQLVSMFPCSHILVIVHNLLLPVMLGTYFITSPSLLHFLTKTHLLVIGIALSGNGPYEQVSIILCKFQP